MKLLRRIASGSLIVGTVPQNQTDSWGNRSTSNARAWDTYDGGDCWTLSAGERDGNLAPWNSDRFSRLATSGGAEAVTRLSQSRGARR
jgi:hypothetical protein